jgi:hypothetical protein
VSRLDQIDEALAYISPKEVEFATAGILTGSLIAHTGREERPKRKGADDGVQTSAKRRKQLDTDSGFVGA